MWALTDMASTDTEQTPVPASTTGTSNVAPPSKAAAIGSDDHKTIGRLYITFAALLGIVAWALQGLSTADNIEGVNVLSDKIAGQVLTLAPLSLVFLLAIPLLLGLATYVVPLQVGSSSLAFPRAAAAAFWAWLASSVVLIVSYLALDGGVAGVKAKAVDLSYLALALAIIALLVGTVCVVATVFTMRPKGMTLDRVPMFSWGMVVGGSVWLLTLPVLLANIALIYLDHHYGKSIDFAKVDNQWQQLSWAIRQPQVFVYAAPALGIIGDVITTMAGVRQRSRSLVMVGIGGFAILSFGSWAQPFNDEGILQRGLFAAVAVLIVLPVMALLAGWVTTATSGKARVTAPGLFALFSMLTFVVAVAASVLFVLRKLRLQETADFQTGVLALVIGATTMAALAGLHYWAPKIWGRSSGEGIARLSALLAFVGTLLAGLMLCALGFGTRFNAIGDAQKFLNGAGAAGAALVAVAVLLSLMSIGMGAKGAAVGDNPWGTGQTLEWATSSPPPVDNFGEIADVVSPEPLLDLAGSAKEQ